MAPVVDWGVQEYPCALTDMRRWRAARRRGEVGDTLLLVEHPPVVTVGVQGLQGPEPPVGVPTVYVERGGHETYHGPGQLVGYPIVDLDRRGRDVRRFVGELEAMVIESVRPFGISAGPVPGKRGVWVDGRRKIASVGIAVEQWVSFHGFALNVGSDLSGFAAIRPCGFDPGVMTSVSREAGREVAVRELLGPITQAWRARFEAGDPLASTPRARLPLASP